MLSREAPVALQVAEFHEHGYSTNNSVSNNQLEEQNGEGEDDTSQRVEQSLGAERQPMMRVGGEGAGDQLIVVEERVGQLGGEEEGRGGSGEENGYWK